MSVEFKPRNAGDEAWKDWLKNGVALAIRRPFMNLSLSLFFVLALWGLFSLNFYTCLFILLMSPVFGLTMFIRHIYHVDHNEVSRLLDLIPNLRTCARLMALVFIQYVISLGAVYFVKVIFILMEAMKEISPDAISEVNEAVEHSIWETLSIIYLVAIYLWLVYSIIFRAWFLIPLLSLHDIPLRTAWCLNCIGDEMNISACHRVWIVIMICALLLAFIPYSIFIAVPASPIIGAVLYAAYRDVFTGRKDNKPVPVSAGVLRSNTA